jgi:hypothetical protein
MSGIGDRENELAARWAALSTKTAADPQSALDSAHICRALNDEYSRLTRSGTVANAQGVSGNLPISSGSTLVSLSTGLTLRASTVSWFSGQP